VCETGDITYEKGYIKNEKGDQHGGGGINGDKQENTILKTPDHRQ
jgi:hypothetical protein